jgi:hypothetical protein
MPYAGAYPQTLDQAGKAFQEQKLKLILALVLNFHKTLVPVKTSSATFTKLRTPTTRPFPLLKLSLF